VSSQVTRSQKLFLAVRAPVPTLAGMDRLVRRQLETMRKPSPTHATLEATFCAVRHAVRRQMRSTAERFIALGAPVRSPSLVHRPYVYRQVRHVLVPFVTLRALMWSVVVMRPNVFLQLMNDRKCL